MAKIKTNESELIKLHEQFIKAQAHAGGNTRVTIKNHRDNFQLLLQFKPDITLKDLTEEIIVDFLEFLDTRERIVGNKKVIRTYKASSRETVRGKLNTFFNWLVERKHLKISPFAKLPHASVDYTDRRAFTKEEFEKICLAVLVKIPWENQLLKKRNIGMIMTLALTGLRKNEFLHLKLEDLNTKNKTINVNAETSKSRRVRTIPLHPELLPYHEEYMQSRSEYKTPYLWVSSNEDRALTSYGMKHFTDRLSKITGINCHLHRFRHTFAVSFYRKTHDLVALNKLMGHKSLKMTLIYLRSLTDEDTLGQLSKMGVDELL